MIETLEKLCTLIDTNKHKLNDNDYIKIMEHLKSLYDNKIINLLIVDDYKCAGYDNIDDTNCYYNGNMISDDEDV